MTTDFSQLLKFKQATSSPLGPLSFSLYMLLLVQVLHRRNVKFHPYADDTELYISLKPNEFWQLNTLNNCLHDLKCWMAQNSLQLNMDKTEVMIIGPDSVNTCSAKHLASVFQNINQNSKNLELFSKQTCECSCPVMFLQLRQLSQISSILSRSHLK